MVRSRTAALVFGMAMGLLARPAQARKEGSTVVRARIQAPRLLSAPEALAAQVLRRAPQVPISPEMIRLPAQLSASACAACGHGIPDAQLSRHLRLGADSFSDRLRLYVKMDRHEALGNHEVAVDVGRDAAVVVYGLQF